ncbi:MAG: hypothetical protein BIFFINMI_00244 [Phycisphaerae bacterium]|nr:hypothetical protein [Phycisphaerae bacterium]
MLRMRRVLEVALEAAVLVIAAAAIFAAAV